MNNFNNFPIEFFVPPNSSSMTQNFKNSSYLLCARRVWSNKS